MKGIRQRYLLAAVLLLITAIFFSIGVGEKATKEREQKMVTEETIQVKQKSSRVRITSIPEGVEEYTEVVVYVDEEKLPLYNVKVNDSQIWNGETITRVDSGVGFIELEGKATITVKLPYEIDYSSKVRPLSAEIIPVADIENQSISFEVISAGSYVIEPNGDKNKAIHLFISEFAEEVPTEGNVIYFGRGVHNAQNNSYIDKDNVIHVPSNTKVYLERGAIVRAKFVANDAKNITIMGQGIIDGSTFARNAYTGEVTVPIDFNHCTDVTLKDFSVLDPAGWCVNFYYNKDSIIDNIKIITSRSNGDGISVQSCQNITIKNCFVRSWDDSLVVKNYPDWTNRSKHGKTDNIVFENCILWTDLAQSMEIGYETVGEHMENIVFRNITVLHALHRPPISIHNANNANIKNVLYENITIEDASMGQGDAGSNRQLIDFQIAYSDIWSSQHTETELGTIDGVRVRNVKVIKSGKNSSISVVGTFDKREGYQTEHIIRNVRIENLEIKGVVQTEENVKLTVNPFTESITILIDSEKITGADYWPSQSEEELLNYSNELSIIID